MFQETEEHMTSSVVCQLFSCRLTVGRTLTHLSQAVRVRIKRWKFITNPHGGQESSCFFRLMTHVAVFSCQSVSHIHVDVFGGGTFFRYMYLDGVMEQCGSVALAIVSLPSLHRCGRC